MASPTVPIPLPNPEVRERPTRRHFTLADKQRILTAAAACTERGSVGALLRREGLYASQLATWRQQQRDGSLTGPRGRRRAEDTVELLRLRREHARLTRDLEVAHAVIDVQKKLSVLLGVTLPPLPEPQP
jgi:transposase-like protein